MGASKLKSKVRFNLNGESNRPKHTIHEIPKLSPNEIDNSWYCYDEYKEFQESFSYVVLVIDMGNADEIENNDNHDNTIVGLEKHTSNGSLERYEHKRNYYKAVFNEQELQRRQNNNLSSTAAAVALDWKKISNACFRVTTKPLALAQERAAKVHNDIQDYIANNLLLDQIQKLKKLDYDDGDDRTASTASTMTSDESLEDTGEPFDEFQEKQHAAALKNDNSNKLRAFYSHCERENGFLFDNDNASNPNLNMVRRNEKKKRNSLPIKLMSNLDDEDICMNYLPQVRSKSEEILREERSISCFLDFAAAASSSSSSSSSLSSTQMAQSQSNRNNNSSIHLNASGSISCDEEPLLPEMRFYSRSSSMPTDTAAEKEKQKRKPLKRQSARNRRHQSPRMIIDKEDRTHDKVSNNDDAFGNPFERKMPIRNPSSRMQLKMESMSSPRLLDTHESNNTKNRQKQEEEDKSTIRRKMFKLKAMKMERHL